MKVKLIPPKPHPCNKGNLVLSHSLPFFRTRQGLYIHRVRSGQHYFRDGHYSHTAINFWCGGCGFPGSDAYRRGEGRFFDTPPENAIHCAICEAKVIGAGLTESRVIAGHTVMFKPLTPSP